MQTVRTGSQKTTQYAPLGVISYLSPLSHTDKESARDSSDTEQIEVTDRTHGGHLLPLTLFSDDALERIPDQPLIVPSHPVALIHTEKLLYEISRKRTITQVKKSPVTQG